jgi:hypothetical protein
VIVVLTSPVDASLAVCNTLQAGGCNWLHRVSEVFTAAMVHIVVFWGNDAVQSGTWLLKFRRDIFHRGASHSDVRWNLP